MTGTLKFRWTGKSFERRVRSTSSAALDRTKEDAYKWWLVHVPIVTGALRDSWFAYTTQTPTGVWLIIGAGGESAPYAIYVELGTGVMTPRAPIRATAAEVVPFVIPHLRRSWAA